LNLDSRRGEGDEKGDKTEGEQEDEDDDNGNCDDELG
jgi:hypothetical protein